MVNEKDGNPINILLIEDKPDDVHFIKKLLAEETVIPYNLKHIERLSTGLETVAREGSDVILLNMRLPDNQGLDTLKIARTQLPGKPIVVLDNIDDKELDLQAIREGAQDYLAKRKVSSGEALWRTIRYAIERKRVEEKQLQSEARYRILFEQSIDPIFITTQSGEFVDLNQSMLDLFGYTREEIMSMNILELYSNPADRSKFQKEGGEKGFVKDYELKLRKKDGTEIECLLTSTLRLEDNGNILGHQGIIHDITERKHMALSLRKNEQRLKAAEELGRLGNWEFDLTNQKTEWSDEVYILYERDKSLGPPTPEEEANYYAPEEARRLREFQRLAVETGEELNYDFTAKLPSGDIAFFNTWMRPVKDGKGRVIKLFGTVQDITERKRVEKELEQSSANLKKAIEATVKAIALTSEIRDPYTAGHQQRVASLACAIAKDMGINGKRLEALNVAGLLHDIGKIYVPAEILSKPTKLNEIEMNLIRTHAQLGSDILETLELPWVISPIVLQHHERMDGSGYPAGISGENITIEARMLAVADVVEAISSHRPYRPSLGINQALKEIQQNKGKLYDPDVVDACVRLFKEKNFNLAEPPRVNIASSLI